MISRFKPVTFVFPELPDREADAVLISRLFISLLFQVTARCGGTLCDSEGVNTGSRIIGAQCIEFFIESKPEY